MKISIITVSLNSASTIRDTLNSIHSQDYDDIEHIIIDGGSTDDTLKIVREFPHVNKVISEKDNGLYDAMNKGINMATGELIGILNSDDVYAGPDILSKVAGLFLDKSIKTSYGDLQFVNSTDLGKVVRTWKSGTFKPSDFYYGWMPPHPTFFVRREVYSQVGLFNRSLNSAADYELMLRILFKNRFTAAYLPEVLVKMRVGGISTSSIRQRIRSNKEDRIAWKINELKPYFFHNILKTIEKGISVFTKIALPVYNNMMMKTFIASNDLIFESTSHGVGLKKVLLNGSDTSTKLTQLAYAKLVPGDKIPMHAHNSMEEIFYFINGTGIYTIDNIEYQVSPAIVIRIPAGVSHALRATGDATLEFLYFGIAIT